MPKNKSHHPHDDTDENKQAEELLTHPSHDEILQKLDEAEQKANENWERVLRMQADAENASRRYERELANAHKYAIDKFVAELLPIMDSLELCIAKENSDNPATASVVEGVSMTLKMFTNAMDKFGVQQINPEGQPYDPEYQQAISVQEDASVKPGTVISVLQKGYTLHGRLVRPALVVVSKA